MYLTRRTLIVAAAGATIASASRAAANPATVPVPRPEFPWWMERHQVKLAEVAQVKPDLVFIGDSITHDYEFTSPYPQYDFASVWQRFYGARRAVNLGFNGDSTSNVLWRLHNGEVAGIRPRLVVLLIGTNNTIQGQTAEQTAGGIEAVVADLRQRLPSTKILVIGILPSGVSDLKTAIDQSVNVALAEKYARGGTVTFLDISHVFLKDGVLDVSLFMDPRNTPPGPAIHPDAFAQARMAEAIEPTLAGLYGA